MVPREILDSGMPIFVSYEDWKDRRPRTEHGLLLIDNPVEFPPQEIIRHGPLALSSYLDSLDRAKARPLSEVKLIVVGHGGAGKTSLVKGLLGDGFDAGEPQTHGINIRMIQQGDYGMPARVNLWDFGGQEIMHATHQFFLTSRSIYVVVLDGRKDEDAEYWLNHVRSFGGDSPVLVVLNKMDEHPSYDVNRRFLVSKYPQIKGYFGVSCKSQVGLKELRSAIAAAVKSVEVVGTLWPEPWFRVKKELECMTASFIGVDDYIELCRRCGLRDDPSRDTLVRFLHDLGVVVHFEDFALSDTHVLKPKWLTGGVYRVLNAPEAAEAKGVLPMRVVGRVLGEQRESADAEFDYPAQSRRYIIGLMKKFELCYELDGDRVLIPDLLDVQEPDHQFNENAAVRFRLQYEFLPRSIIARFIVKQHGRIEKAFRWRTGVVLNDLDFECRALVRADQAAKKIDLFVTGKDVRSFLAVLRGTLLEINSTYERIGAIERVPLPDNPRVSVGYEHLLKIEATGASEYFPDGATRPYELRELLGQIYLAPGPGGVELETLLRKVIREANSESDALNRANKILMLQPNFAGFGLNLNELIGDFWRRRRKNKE